MAPDHPDLQEAAAHYKAGRLAEASAACSEGLRKSPADAPLHQLLGGVLQSQQLLDEAIAAYDRALAIDDRLTGAWYGSACALYSKGEYAAALDRFERAAALAPGQAEVHHNAANALYRLGLVDESIGRYRRSLELREDLRPRTALATVIPGGPAADHAAVLAERRHWFETYMPASPAKPLRPGLDAGGRLRIGYLSSFFHGRNWMKPVWGLINRHDRNGFEVHLFSDGPEGACAGYRRDERDRFHDISELSNRDAAARIEASGIDILVDLNGYSRLPRLEVVALRPAPIQAAWFNMYGASGMACFDYLIGDVHVIDQDEERFYSERVVRVPGSYLTFDVGYPAPDVADPPCRSAGRLTFGCLASQYKITPQVIETWSRILARAPESKLFLKNSTLGSGANRAHVAGRFGRHEISADRLVMEGPAEHFEFLSAYARVDVALDPFPYNGGTTTMEALWQGVPVLTFRGDRWASRQSASLLRAGGLDDFVAAGVDDLVDRAVRLSHDLDRIAEVRRGLRARLAASPACDTAAFARSMEALYREFVERRARLDSRPRLP
ncbi:MAG TPA: tetratricopeptide repeat protein [Planctomycetota bacterium]|nr:tetratricopeptide repeat protein [Planctomycetota bacterium]